jgi:hypothetical protein
MASRTFINGGSLTTGVLMDISLHRNLFMRSWKDLPSDEGHSRLSLVKGVAFIGILVCS